MDRRRWLVMSAVLAVVVSATPAMAQGNGKGNGGGKGGGGKTTTISVTRVTIHDAPGMALYSDALERILPDADADGFLELMPASSDAVSYQDGRLTFDDAGTYPDPCSVFEVTTDGSNGGRVRALLDSQSCSFLEPAFADDARTFTLVFDKGTPGGSCACDQFRYLVDADGNPAPMYNGELAETTFAETDDSCTLGIAAGAIVTDSGHSFTASQQIVAWPYEELMSTKGRKSSQTMPGMTSVNINFRTDRINAGEQKNWQLISQEENIPITPMDPDPGDPRVLTSTGEQLFYLANAGETQCVDIALPFQVTFEKFEIEGQ